MKLKKLINNMKYLNRRIIKKKNKSTKNLKRKKVIKKILNLKKYINIILSMKHLYGLKKIKYKSDEVILLCLVKNGEVWIKSFIEYYLRFGFKHIIFLDNNSSDNTIEIAKSYNNISIFQTKIPFKNNNIIMRRYLINKFARNRWSLCVDIDEFFDFPFSNKISLSSFINYLNKFKYTAVITQMLDMFSNKKINETEFKFINPFNSELNYYDLSNITFLDYKDGIKINKFGNKNIIINNDIKLLYGGIRKKIFGINVWLTKHSLVYNNLKLKHLTHQHFSNNARIADISCVLFHYKFIKGFDKKVKDAVMKENYADDSKEYKNYYKVLKKEKDICLKSNKSKKINNINQLIDDSFIIVTNEYLNWINKE